MKLNNIKRVVLQAGHGAGDPGAVWNGAIENTEVNEIIKRLEPILKDKGVDVVVTPDLGFIDGINYVNRYYNQSSDWVLEIHKDSAPSMVGRDVKRMGVYHYGGNTWSRDVGEVFKNTWKSEDSQNQYNAWNRPDTVANHGRLGWLRDTKAPSHLIESGFVQGFTGNESYDYYAKMIAKPILELLDKDQNISDKPETNEPNKNMSVYGWNNNLENNPNFSYYKNKADQNDKSLVSDVADRDDEIKELKEKFDEARKESDSLRAELLEKESEITLLQEELRKIESNNEKVSSRIQEIQAEAHDNVQEYKSNIQDMLKHAQSVIK